MNNRLGRRKRGLAELAGVLLVLTCLTPAWGACNPRAGYWDWDRCWFSVPRGILWIVLSLVALWVCIDPVFRWLLKPAAIEQDSKTQRTLAPWPKNALGTAFFLFCTLATLLFVLFYGVLSDELRHDPLHWLPAWPWIAWLNPYLKIVFAFLIGEAVAVAFKFGVFRHSRSAAA